MTKRQQDGNWSGAFGTAASIGFLLVSSLAAGLVLGIMADRYLHSVPWGTISGIVLGMLTGMWTTYKKLMKQK
jgi:ATP synthase protein I